MTQHISAVISYLFCHCITFLGYEIVVKKDLSLLKHFFSKGVEDKKGDTQVSKEQDLLFDVMQDLRELNNMSSKQDYNKDYKVTLLKLFFHSYEVVKTA